MIFNDNGAPSPQSDDVSYEQPARIFLNAKYYFNLFRPKISILSRKMTEKLAVEVDVKILTEEQE